MFVKPGPRPDGRVLSPIGEDVPETQSWNRRLREGDVVLAEPVPTSAFDPAASATPREAAP